MALSVMRDDEGGRSRRASRNQSERMMTYSALLGWPGMTINFEMKFNKGRGEMNIPLILVKYWIENFFRVEGT